MFSVVDIKTTQRLNRYADKDTSSQPQKHGLMADPIIPIAKIRDAARQAVLANIPVKNCPPGFLFAEELWRGEYWFAHYELTCKEQGD